MVDLLQEREHLILADRHVAEGEQRINEQFALIQRMTRQGYDIAVAKELLRLLKQTLTGWQEHRQLILEAIARHELSASLPSEAAGPEVLQFGEASQPGSSGIDSALPESTPDA